MISKIILLISLISSASATTCKIDLECLKSIKIFNGDTVQASSIKKINLIQKEISFIELKDGLIIDSSDIREIKLERLNQITDQMNIHFLRTRGDGSGG